MQPQKNIRGQRFQQDMLDTDWSGKIPGQRIITKTTLILLLCIFGFIVSFLTGYISATSILGLFTPEYRWTYVCATLTMAVWFLAVNFKSYPVSLLIAFLNLLLLIVGASILKELISLQLPHDFILLALIVFPFVLVICSATFFFSRFSNTVIDILLINSFWVKTIRISGTAFICIASTIGSSVLVSAIISDQFRGSPMRDMLLALDGSQFAIVKSIAILTGCIYTFALVLSGCCVNRRQGSPWNYPDMLRTLSLAIGSWRGTSFYNLNLSRANFKGCSLANTDLRAHNLYRVCFQGVKGLDRARVNNRYLDLEIPKVQQLLTNAYSNEQDFSRINLRGAYLQDADLRRIILTEAELSGADLQRADLRGAILVGAQVLGVNFSQANLTGICIKDWSVNDQTHFSNVLCDYIYREVDETGKPNERYPFERNFEPREFESLYQEVSSVVELIFKEGLNWRAFAFTLQKLQLEDEDLGLELKGIEKRGDLWVVKVTYNENIPTQEVEKHISNSYEQLQQQIATKEQQINKLLGIASNQSEVLKELTKKPFGNSFFITGSSITNLAGNGEIKYSEAADQVRNVVANGADFTQFRTIGQNLLLQFQEQNIATKADTQAELIQQVILAEAEKDPVFKQFLLHQGQQFTDTMPESAITTGIKFAIALLRV